MERYKQQIPQEKKNEPRENAKKNLTCRIRCFYIFSLWQIVIIDVISLSTSAAFVSKNRLNQNCVGS